MGVNEPEVVPADNEHDENPDDLAGDPTFPGHDLDIDSFEEEEPEDGEYGIEGA